MSRSGFFPVSLDRGIGQTGPTIREVLLGAVEHCEQDENTSVSEATLAAARESLAANLDQCSRRPALEMLLEVLREAKEYWDLNGYADLTDDDYHRRLGFGAGLAESSLVAALQVFDNGCQGRHQGSGHPDCPRRLHHHHDDKCPGLPKSEPR